MNDIAAKHQAAPGIRTTRLLIPVDATDRSRWGLRYALRLREKGVPLHAVLLFVAEPVTRLEVLRFRAHDEIARFQAESGSHILDDAAQALVDAGMAHEQIFREGDIVFQILDVAEQLGCDEIVLPMPRPLIASLLRRDVVREVMRQERETLVITIDSEGRDILNRPR
ncbi:MAG TPA: universal stress protein [Candidatus Desulfobacillus sp.]|nr:universal stress protein [Candidatus Desulfobacillus sp.]